MFKCGQLQCTITANLFPKLVTGRHVLTLGITRSIFIDPLSLSFFLSLIASWSKFSEVRSWQNDLSLCFIFNVNAYKSASVDQLSIQVIVRPWMLSQSELTHSFKFSIWFQPSPTNPSSRHVEIYLIARRLWSRSRFQVTAVSQLQGLQLQAT
jgi:hypothetical protein